MHSAISANHNKLSFNIFLRSFSNWVNNLFSHCSSMKGCYRQFIIYLSWLRNKLSWSDFILTNSAISAKQFSHVSTWIVIRTVLFSLIPYSTSQVTQLFFILRQWHSRTAYSNSSPGRKTIEQWKCFPDKVVAKGAARKTFVLTDTP